MKKLMLAAFAASMVAGANAICVDPEDPVVTTNAVVMNLKVSLKTLKAKSKTVKSTCADDEVNCYMVVGTKVYEGVLCSCEAVCDLATVRDNGKFYFWNKTDKYGYCDATFTLENCVRYNSYLATKANKVAATFTITSESEKLALAGAGFGTLKDYNQRLDTISGYIAGVVDTPACIYTAECEDPEEKAAYGFVLCEDTVLEPECVPGYGSWRFYYNASASKKYKADSTYVESKMIPSYWFTCVDD